MHQSIPLCASCGHHHYIDIKCEICGHIGRSQIFIKMRAKAKEASKSKIVHYEQNDIQASIPLQFLMVEITQLPSNELLSYDLFILLSG